MSVTCLNACDKADAPLAFLRSHREAPLHVHTDLFARLSRAALQELEEAEQTMKDVFVEMELEQEKIDKQVLEASGDELLAKYMQVLNRPGAMVSKSFCASTHTRFESVSQRASS